MSTFEDRLRHEEAELSHKIMKLSAFMYRDVYAGLPSELQSLLMTQLQAMEMYSEVLNIRIERFST